MMFTGDDGTSKHPMAMETTLGMQNSKLNKLKSGLQTINTDEHPIITTRKA